MATSFPVVFEFSGNTVAFCADAMDAIARKTPESSRFLIGCILSLLSCRCSTLSFERVDFRSMESMPYFYVVFSFFSSFP